MERARYRENRERFGGGTGSRGVARLVRIGCQDVISTVYDVMRFHYFDQIRDGPLWATRHGAIGVEISRYGGIDLRASNARGPRRGRPTIFLMGFPSG